MHAQSLKSEYYILMVGGVPEDKGNAKALWLDSAEHGYAQAQVEIGRAFKKGLGEKQDYAEAMKWLDKAAKQGNAEAEVMIGLMYLNGEGVRKDEANGLKWLCKSAIQGYGNAQGQLGQMYQYGRWGVKQNYKEAYYWWSLPGAQSYTPGMNKEMAKHLSAKQISEVNKMVRNWIMTPAQSIEEVQSGHHTIRPN